MDSRQMPLTSYVAGGAYERGLVRAQARLETLDRQGNLYVQSTNGSEPTADAAMVDTDPVDGHQPEHTNGHEVPDVAREYTQIAIGAGAVTVRRAMSMEI